MIHKREQERHSYERDGCTTPCECDNNLTIYKQFLLEEKCELNNKNCWRPHIYCSQCVKETQEQILVISYTERPMLYYIYSYRNCCPVETAMHLKVCDLKHNHFQVPVKFTN